jgi:hypothetical protein
MTPLSPTEAQLICRGPAQCARLCPAMPGIRSGNSSAWRTICSFWRACRRVCMRDAPRQLSEDYRGRSPLSPSPGFALVLAHLLRSAASERPTSSSSLNWPRSLPRTYRLSPPVPMSSRLRAIASPSCLNWVVLLTLAHAGAPPSSPPDRPDARCALGPYRWAAVEYEGSRREPRRCAGASHSTGGDR